MVLAGMLAGRLLAGTGAPPKVPGRPTAEFRAIVKELDGASFVVINYLDGTKAFVADPEWLARLKSLLASAESKPDQLCFCINYPKVTFADKDREILRMEVAHGKKLRFFGGGYLGDFVVDEKIAQQVSEMLMGQVDNAVAPSKRPAQNPTPRKVEIKSGVNAPPSQPKGG